MNWKVAVLVAVATAVIGGWIGIFVNLKKSASRAVHADAAHHDGGGHAAHGPHASAAPADGGHHEDDDDAGDEHARPDAGKRAEGLRLDLGELRERWNGRAKGLATDLTGPVRLDGVRVFQNGGFRFEVAPKVRFEGHVNPDTGRVKRVSLLNLEPEEPRSRLAMRVAFSCLVAALVPGADDRELVAALRMRPAGIAYMEFGGLYWAWRGSYSKELLEDLNYYKPPKEGKGDAGLARGSHGHPASSSSASPHDGHAAHSSNPPTHTDSHGTTSSAGTHGAGHGAGAVDAGDAHGDGHGDGGAHETATVEKRADTITVYLDRPKYWRQKPDKEGH